MSKIKLEGHASGSGVLTIAAPNTDTDRTITIPDVTGTLLDSGSDLPAANLTGTIADARFPATLPAISGANLTGVGVDGISSSADATAITINSDESVDFANDIDVTGSVTADGGLIQTGSSGGTAHSTADDFVVEGSGHTGITILGGNSNSSRLHFADSGANEAGHIVYNHSTDLLELGTAGTPHIKLDSSGQVGIKTTPRDFLSNYASLSLGGKAFLWDVGDEFYVGNNAYYDGSWKYTTTDQASYIKQMDGNIKFEVAPSGTADSAISFTTALEITNDGRGLSQFTAKAWIQFNASNTIQDSHNVSSITDNGTGRTDINWTNAMANNDYSCQTNSSVADIWLKVNSLATTEANLRSVNAEGSYQACTYNFVTVFGD